ncbi:MAG: hypothetical protein PWQ75_1625, partial [Methanolobus sp.]|nr:hypothetical protein [Methanolobus sp.]
MKFNPDDIKKAASEDFDAAWNKGTEYISESKLN